MKYHCPHQDECNGQDDCDGRVDDGGERVVCPVSISINSGGVVMRKKVMMSVVVVFVALLFAGPASAEPNFKEGQWEIKAEMKLEGMPFPMPAIPVNYSQCITKKDMVPQKQEKNQECVKISEKVEGNVVTWAMKCKDAKGAVTESTGKATYAGAAFDAAIHSKTIDAKGAKSESRMTMNGRRTGECK